jgi:hypothetical protein
MLLSLFDTKKSAGKWQEAYGFVENYEKEQGFRFYYILLARSDGLCWERLLSTIYPQNWYIHCRVLNQACGYGASEHLFFGVRKDILSLMSFWRFVDLEFIDTVKKDLMCGPG